MTAITQTAVKHDRESSERTTAEKTYLWSLSCSKSRTSVSSTARISGGVGGENSNKQEVNFTSHPSKSSGLSSVVYVRKRMGDTLLRR